MPAAERKPCQEEEDGGTGCVCAVWGGTTYFELAMLNQRCSGRTLSEHCLLVQHDLSHVHRPLLDPLLLLTQ
jgi:hypothetical protein